MLFCAAMLLIEIIYWKKLYTCTCIQYWPSNACVYQRFILTSLFLYTGLYPIILTYDEFDLYFFFVRDHTSLGKYIFFYISMCIVVAAPTQINLFNCIYSGPYACMYIHKYMSEGVAATIWTSALRVTNCKHTKLFFWNYHIECNTSYNFRHKLDSSSWNNRNNTCDWFLTRTGVKSHLSGIILICVCVWVYFYRMSRNKRTWCNFYSIIKICNRMSTFL